MKILIDHHRTEEIPVIEFYNPEATTKLPLVIILHGFTGRKEHCFSQGYQLAQRGYYAVSIDLYLHGEAAEGEFVPSHVAPCLDEVLVRSVGYIERLVAVYAQNPVADGNRIGLLGISLGGVVIYRYLPHRSPHIRAAVVQIAGATPFWPLTIRKIMQHFPEFGVTEAMVAIAEQRTADEAFLEGVSDFPLLMQYGQADPIVPIEEVRRVYQQIKSQYICPDLLELVEYPNAGHETPPPMFERAWQWLEKHLKS
jgi:hypothetical protein